jgi:hypothetical protein
MRNHDLEIAPNLHLTVKSTEVKSGVLTVTQVKSKGKALGDRTVTCTCTDANGVSYSSTTQCPDGSNGSCDCSNPSSPVAGC